jgi:hypothetical protein
VNITPSSTPAFAVGGAVLETVAAQRFDELAAALDPDASLLALLPRGFFEWHGVPEICRMFQQWFGDVDHFEVADASVGQVGALLQLRWRLRLGGSRLGPGPKVVEQHVYAATGPSGRITRLSLLCSGFWDEHPDAVERSPQEIRTPTNHQEGTRR